MHGNEKVIEQLNAALASELTAIVQYMVQSETCQNWGYVRIGDYLKRRAIEEMGHAEGLIERIVFLDATPKVDVALIPKIGANVQQQLEGDLKDEEDAVHQLCVIRTSETSLAARPSYGLSFSSTLGSWFQRPRL